VTAPTPPPLPPEDQAKLLIELWKQTVAVQQHFNDLCWRIRGLALTALTFAVGAAAVAVRESVEIRVFGKEVQLSCIIAVLGLAVWRAFGYVDRQWYHRLLKGSVKHGEALEAALRSYVPAAGLTRAISESSRYESRPPPLFKKKQIDSTSRLRLFYNVVSLLLLAFAIFVQLGVSPAAEVEPQEHRIPTGAAGTTSTATPTPTANATPSATR
jgi:hypothetical protein